MSESPHEERRPNQSAVQTSPTKSTRSIATEPNHAPILPSGALRLRIRTGAEEQYIRELAAFLGACRQRREHAALRLPPLADGRRDRLGRQTDGATL